MSEIRSSVGAAPVSPAELIRALINDERDPLIIPHVVVGPANADQQTAGVVSITDVGKAKLEKNLPLQWPKHQIRCLAKTLDHADRIAQHVYALLDRRRRTVVFSPLYGHAYLIHFINVAGGPSMHYDSPETWETLLYTDSLIGLDPVS